MVAPIIGGLAISYFVVHSFHGDRGLIAWMQIENEVEIARANLAMVADERQQLETRVARLHSKGIDLDMLEEQTRLMTGLVYPGEVILITNEDAVR